jgi:hypothetical protein
MSFIKICVLDIYHPSFVNMKPSTNIGKEEDIFVEIRTNFTINILNSDVPLHVPHVFVLCIGVLSK